MNLGIPSWDYLIQILGKILDNLAEHQYTQIPERTESITVLRPESSRALVCNAGVAGKKNRKNSRPMVLAA